MRMTDGYCNHSPGGKAWPVCSLPAGHPGGRHESADFWWNHDDAEASVK